MYLSFNPTTFLSLHTSGMWSFILSHILFASSTESHIHLELFLTSVIFICLERKKNEWSINVIVAPQISACIINFDVSTQFAPWKTINSSRCWTVLNCWLLMDQNVMKTRADERMSVFVRTLLFQQECLLQK